MDGATLDGTVTVRVLEARPTTVLPRRVSSARVALAFVTRGMASSAAFGTVNEKLSVKFPDALRLTVLSQLPREKMSRWENPSSCFLIVTVTASPTATDDDDREKDDALGITGRDTV